MEYLYADYLLWKQGFSSQKMYEKQLHELFLADSNDCLLELEMCSNDMMKTGHWLKQYWAEESPEIDASALGRRLMSGLKLSYESEQWNLADFGARCYLLWLDLPESICQSEPFWTLNYADDPLSWGDETQSRRIYEQAFSFYDTFD